MIALALILGLAAPPLAAEEPGDLRLEHFVLERRSGDAAVAPVEVGLVCLRRRTVDGQRQLESESLFFRRGGDTGEDEHVLQVERDSGPGPALVWREWGGTRSRCLTAERTADGAGLLLVETSRGGTPRATIEAPPGVLYPLELVELARVGKLVTGRCLLFDPLSRSLETIEVKTQSGGSSVGDLRTVEFLREDKSSAGRYEFQGSELVGFQWQEGDLHARRVASEMYAARLEASRPPEKRP